MLPPGRPGEQVDPDPAEKLPLRLGDVSVARPDQHVDRGDRFGPERHRADGLHTPEAIDHVRAGEVPRRDDRGRRPALVGRRARRDPRDAGDLRGDDRHARGREERVFPTRNVAAHGIDRNVLVAEHNARQRLDLDVPDRFARCRSGRAWDAPIPKNWARALR